MSIHDTLMASLRRSLAAHGAAQQALQARDRALADRDATLATQANDLAAHKAALAQQAEEIAALKARAVEPTEVTAILAEVDGATSAIRDLLGTPPSA